MKQRSERVFAKWQNLISEQGQSGQSTTAFCRERGLSRSNFYLRKKQLGQAASAQFVEVHVPNRDLKQRHSGAAAGSAIEIRLRNGRSLMVAPEFNASHLRALLAVVESES